MRAGSLRHQITIKNPIAGQDGYGAPASGSGITFCNTRAAINSPRGRKFLEANQPQSENIDVVTTRYRPGIKPYMIVEFSGRTLEILYIVNPEERNRELHLMCRELVK